jgi:hypothetical protein
LKNQLILLTGCIDTKNMFRTQLHDIQVRRQQYLDSIKFYLNETDLPLLFVENSGNDLSYSFAEEINSKRLEILTFNGNEFDRSLGKGFGEMLILEHAVLFSKLFAQADFVFKITGRYKVLNINSFINYCSQNQGIDLLVNFKPDLSFADSRFFGAKMLFYKDVLLSFKSLVNDAESVFFEHALSKAVHESIINGYQYSGLYPYPRFSGFRGTDGSHINDSWIYWILKQTLYKILTSIQGAFQIR